MIVCMELWRVISIRDGLMKIIRNESIGLHMWDGSNKHNWNRPANIKTYLNDTYYNTLSTQAKEQMQDGLFNIGLVSSSDSSARAIKEVEISVTWNGKVGLMNVSDYAYSSKLMIAVLMLVLIERRIIQPVTMVGLYSGQQEWTMNGSDRNLRYVFFVDTGGQLNGYGGRTWRMQFVQRSFFLQISPLLQGDKEPRVTLT